MRRLHPPRILLPEARFRTTRSTCGPESARRALALSEQELGSP